MRLIEKTRIAAFVVAASTTMIASQALADILVLRSNGPIAQRIRAGTMLPDARPIRLGSNDSLELLSDTGTWSWRGPGDFPAAAGAARGPSIAAPNSRRTRVGAVRSVGSADNSRPNLWMVDVAQPGVVCVLKTDTPLLWRHDADAADVMVLAGPDSGPIEVRWSPGQSTADWPQTVPVRDGATYRLSSEDTSASIELVVRSLDTAPTSAPTAGMALIQRGCAAQVDLLARQMEPRDELAGS